MALPHLNLPKDDNRVCDTCFRYVLPKLENKNDSKAPEDLSLHGVLQPRAPVVSPWLYAWHALSREENEVPIGQLYVQVLCGRHLPVMDRFTSDPYVLLNVGEPKENKKNIGKTDVKKSTLNPNWNQNFLLDVYDATESLVLTVFDWDKVVTSTQRKRNEKK